MWRCSRRRSEQPGLIKVFKDASYSLTDFFHCDIEKAN